MARLLEIQRDFAVALFDPARAVPSVIGPDGGRPAVKRFSVYRNNVIMSLTEVLEAYFSVVARLLGEEFFRATARAFIIAHPPRSPILSRYGGELADFLDGFAPVADVPYLSDVARLEWMQQRAYHAADAAALSAHDLASIRPDRVPRLRFRFHASVGVLKSAFPVFSIWRTNTFDDDVEAIGADAPGQSVLVSRVGLDVRSAVLPPGSETFVTALIAGATLGEAAAQGGDASADFDLQQAIGLLIAMEALVAVSRTGSTASLSSAIHGVAR